MEVDPDVNYSLICAVREGRLERARQFINHFGLSCSQGYSLLCDALKNEYSAIANLLLINGSTVNSQNQNASYTPLHYAAKNGDIEIIKMLLNRGANVNAKNEYGRTPLHYNIIFKKKIEVTDLLLEHGVDVNVRDIEGLSVLHIAAEKGCLQTAEHLLRYGADVNCVCTGKWKKYYTPLHFAVEDHCKEIIKLLLSRGANVDAKGKDSVTPLHIAAEKGYNHIVEDLLNHGACIDSVTFEEGYTPLYFATKNGHKTVVNLLLQRGAKVDTQNKKNETILFLAVQYGYLTIVEDVLKYCPDVKNQSNRSSLIKIAMRHHGENYKKIVESLAKYGIINPEDAKDFSLLHSAVAKGHLTIVEDLLKHGAAVNPVDNLSFEEGLTPLHLAAMKRQEEVAKLLIRYEADVNASDKTGKTPIFYAIENTDLKIAKLLLTNRASIKNTPDLLNIAVENQCIEIVEALLEHGADINASDEYGRTALHFTCLSRYEGVSGFRSNIYVKQARQGEVAKFLLSKGANVDAQTTEGITTLCAAIQKGYAKVVEALLEYNANVNSKSQRGITPLHFSVQRGNEEISTILLNKGADVNAKQEDGVAALHIATKKCHGHVVKVLLKYGAKVDSKTKNGITPLHVGAQEGYQEIIETLLKCGANVDSRDKHGRTALHFACKKIYKEVVVTLLANGSDINITDIYDSTPLFDVNDTICSFLSKLINCHSTEDYDSYDLYQREINDGKLIVEALERHVVKIQTADLYVCEENLVSISDDDFNNFQDECEKEIAKMKREKIGNPNISFYDILVKGTKSLAIWMRNEDVVQVLKSDEYKTEFPIYASMIQINFEKSMERKELLEQVDKIFHFLCNHFPKLPYDCTENIFSYLSNEDLRILRDTCEPLSISDSNADVNHVYLKKSRGTSYFQH